MPITFAPGYDASDPLGLKGVQSALALLAQQKNQRIEQAYAAQQLSNASTQGAAAQMTLDQARATQAAAAAEAQAFMDAGSRVAPNIPQDPPAHSAQGRTRASLRWGPAHSSRDSPGDAIQSRRGDDVA